MSVIAASPRSAARGVMCAQCAIVVVDHRMGEGGGIVGRLARAIGVWGGSSASQLRHDTDVHGHDAAGMLTIVVVKM